jgi:holo-[acyl-carrier protein] synthase
MLDAALLAEPLRNALNAPAAGVRVGIDMASVPAIAESLARFGERFTVRLFTEQERADALVIEGAQAERLAARFAVKEAVIKALDLAQAGIGWREIELTRGPGGQPSLALHGRTAEIARRQRVREWAVSISHDGPQACAVVVALLDPEFPNPDSSFETA